MTDEADRAERARGLLLGLAAGDRNGGPIRMAAFVAGSLLDRSTFDTADLFRRYLDWWRNGAFDTGEVFHRVFTQIDEGLDPSQAVRRVDEELRGKTAGCNPAHRAVPLAAAAFLSDKEVVDYARAEARLTHYSSLAGTVSASTVQMCRKLICGVPWADAVAMAKAGVADNMAVSRQRGRLSTGGFAPDVWVTALHFLDRGRTFREAIETSLAFAGPANYCPVLVGSMGGARWGAGAIPDDLLSHCDIMDEISRLADALSSTWYGPSGE